LQVQRALASQRLSSLFSGALNAVLELSTAQPAGAGTSLRLFADLVRAAAEPERRRLLGCPATVHALAWALYASEETHGDRCARSVVRALCA
jgi:hypothetical protein